MIGGGITGLAAAQRLAKQPELKVTVFEASDRLGGVIRTTQQNGFYFEHSADSFLVSDELPWAGQLCQELGVDLIETDQEHRGALILRDGKFHPVPEGLQLLSVSRFRSLVASPLLGWPAKLRVYLERFIPASVEGEEESLEQFTVRRYGREMFEQIIQPLVGGIYTADPKWLSMDAALPQFVRRERKYGSLAKAVAKTESNNSDTGARYRLFRTPTDGMESIIHKLRSQLTNVEFHLGTRVSCLTRDDNTWRLSLANQEDAVFDAVICATSAPALRELVRPISTKLATFIDDIVCVSTAVVCLGYPRDHIDHPMNAFGCVIPAVENRQILAISFTNVKFPARAPDGHALLRVFVCGALQPEGAELSDERTMQLVRSELEELLGVRGEPVASQIVRWPSGTPQYHLGHRSRLQEITKLVEGIPQLEIAGNAYRGVGIPQCVREGWEAADRVTSDWNRK